MNFTKVILKLEFLVYQNIYIYYFILLYTRRAVSTQSNPKSVLREKKTCHLEFLFMFKCIYLFCRASRQWKLESMWFRPWSISWRHAPKVTCCPVQKLWSRSSRALITWATFWLLKMWTYRWRRVNLKRRRREEIKTSRRPELPLRHQPKKQPNKKRHRAYSF